MSKDKMGQGSLRARLSFLQMAIGGGRQKEGEKNLYGQDHRIRQQTYNSVKRIPPERRSAEIRGLIETYGQKADFTDFGSLSRIIGKL